MKKILDRVEQFWCENMHGAPMWPTHGRYQCRVCLREYPVPFEITEDDAMPRREAAFRATTVVARRA